MSKEREKYQEPEIEIVYLEAEDVITTSGDLFGQNIVDGGNSAMSSPARRSPLGSFWENN